MAFPTLTSPKNTGVVKPLGLEDDLSADKTDLMENLDTPAKSIIGSSMLQPESTQGPLRAPGVQTFAEGEYNPGAPTDKNPLGQGAETTPGTETPPETPPETPGAATYDPTTRDVQGNETVAGQLDSILNKDSPLMQSARNRAMQTANSRGLLNTSMAAQAGEQAVIDSAMPIAGADAQAYGQAASENAAAKNTAGQFNANAANQLSLQGLKGDQAKELAGIEANYKMMMQANASAASIFNEVTGNIGKILDDPNTTAEQKQQAVNNQIKMLEASLAIMGSISNLDLASLLDFSNLEYTPPAPPPAPPAPPPPPPPSPSPYPEETPG